jgi:hypothetical protein
MITEENIYQLLLQKILDDSLPYVQDGGCKPRVFPWSASTAPEKTYIGAFGLLIQVVGLHIRSFWLFEKFQVDPMCIK